MKARGNPDEEPATGGPASDAERSTPAPRTRRRAAAAPDATPLGSLSQAIVVPAGTRGCASCGGTDLTRVPLRLNDGAEVVFVSCHDCESRGWFDAEGKPVTDEHVQSRSGRKA